MTTGRSRLIFTAFALMAATSTICHANAEQDVGRVVRQYVEYQQSGDAFAQGRLMLPDRVGAWDNTVHLDSTAEEMSRQRAAFESYRARYPGLEYRVTIRDLHIRVWGDVAAATFYMDMKAIVPASLPAEQREHLSAEVPSKLFCQTLVKRKDGWKIAVTAVSRFADSKH